jgi:hypothetical protein
LIEITGSEAGCDTPQLAAILEALGPEGQQLAWSLFFLDAPGEPDGLCARSEAPSGVRVSWDELRRLADRLEAVYWGTFAAYRPEAGHPDYRSDPRFGTSDLVIEAIDGGYWEVHTSDPRLVERLVAAFPGRARLPRLTTVPEG